MALIKCMYCGCDVSDKAVKCPHCNADLTVKPAADTAPAPLICEECGAEIPQGMLDCPVCGCPVPMKTPAPKAAVPADPAAAPAGTRALNETNTAEQGAVSEQNAAAVTPNASAAQNAASAQAGPSEQPNAAPAQAAGPIAGLNITPKVMKMIAAAVAVLVLIIAAVTISQNTLTGQDKVAYELVMDVANNFKDPSSVRLMSGTVGVDNDCLFCGISAVNGFGVRSTSYYFIYGGDIMEENDPTQLYRETEGLNFKKINRKLEKSLKSF